MVKTTRKIKGKYRVFSLVDHWAGGFEDDDIPESFDTAEEARNFCIVKNDEIRESNPGKSPRWYFEHEYMWHNPDEPWILDFRQNKQTNKAKVKK